MVSLADGAVVAAQVGGSVMLVNTPTARMDAVVLALGNLERQHVGVHLEWCASGVKGPVRPIPKAMPKTARGR